MGTLTFSTEGSGGITKSLIQRLCILDQWFSDSSIYDNHLDDLLNRSLGLNSPRVSGLAGLGWG